MPSRTGRPWRRLRRRIIRRDGGICHLCGRPGANTADHLTPVSLGGAIYDETNLAAAHIACNRQRGNRSVSTTRAEIAATNGSPNDWTW